MDAERLLNEAYMEWRHLAEVEGEAIALRNWSMVAASQNALQHLQRQISRLAPMVRADWLNSGAEGAAKERALNAVIRELIGLERRNRTLLEGLYEAACIKREELDQASRNLKQIQRSYNSGRPAAWTSFS